MASSRSCTFLLVLAISLIYCYASSKYSSPTIASEQIKFWAKNVISQMPNPILAKLSPLCQEDTDLFTKLISTNDNKFSTNENLCSLAKLSCKPELDAVRPLAQAYLKRYSSSNHISDIPKGKVDPFSFFRLSVLKHGNLVHLPNLQQSLPQRAFLPPEITSKISLSSINDIAKLFPQSLVGATKEQIETTLFDCNAEAIKGETKSCPKSLEEMISFSKMVLGRNKMISLISKSTKGSNSVLMIKAIKQFKNDKFVACHEAFLPFATYFCHSFPEAYLYMVDFVEPKTGAPVNSVLAICHMDTSPWAADHVAFKILKFAPGQGEACHWLSQLDLAWIAADGESVTYPA